MNRPLKRPLKHALASTLALLLACGGGEDTVELAALPTGSGLYFTTGSSGFPDANFFRLNELTGEVAIQPTEGGRGANGAGSCPAIMALDTRPDGVVLAVARASAALMEVDPRTTLCRTLAALPEVMTAVAVRADGRIFTITSTQKLDAFNSSGGLISSTPLLCPAGTITCRADGIDFAPDGTLYAIGPFGVWSRLDTATGQLATIRTSVGFSDDFDIDTAGRVRGLASGEYRSFDLTGIAVGTAVNVAGGTLWATGVVYR